MKFTILGGGLSALSLAYFLQNNNKIEKITILEKSDKAGGICRTYEEKGIQYDVGPHIIFSKDKEILDLMNSLLGENNEKHRRSNRIIHKKRCRFFSASFFIMWQKMYNIVCRKK